MISARFLGSLLVVTTIQDSWVKSDICNEEIVLSLSTGYEGHNEQFYYCYGTICQDIMNNGWYIYPYDSLYLPPLEISDDLDTQHFISCGSENNVTLPLVLPDLQECDYCDVITLEIKRLNGSSLPEWAFKGLDVQRFRLNHLGLNYISTGAFEGQENCYVIHLSGNNIKEIHPDVFGGLKHLAILDMSYNTIKELNDFMLNISKENYFFLNLSHNEIESLGKKHFKTSFQNLSSLDLSFNEIAEIDFDDVGDRFTSLDVSHNHLSSISGCIYKIPQLLLSHNKIKSMQIVCSNEKLAMTYLDISYNQISTLNFQTFPENFKIKVLLMQNNVLRNISVGTFSNLNQLEFLNLSSNRIDSLPQGSFENLEGLKCLDLSNNDLKKFDFLALHSFRALEQIYIQKNVIRDFDCKKIIQKFTKLKLINLDANNFTCDHLLEMTFYLEENDIEIVYGTTKYTKNVRGISCYSPRKFVDKFKGIVDVKLSKKETSYYYQISILFWIGLMIMTVLLLVLTFQLYIFHYRCQFRPFENVELM